jgi:hypothetical protein
MRLKSKLLSVRLEIVQMLMQDRCTICAKRIIGSKIILMHPMELLGDMGHLEACFSPLGGGVTVGAR